MLNPVAVLVTGVGGGGVGEQIVKALRMGAGSYVIHCADMKRESLGLLSADVAHVLPPASDEAYVDRLIDLCRSASIQVLLPGSEAELMVIATEQARFRELGVFLPINPPSVLDVCLDKFKTSAWLDAHGFAAPVTFEVNDPADLESIDVMPAVLKPGTGGGGSAHLLLAQSSRELAALGHYLFDTIGPFVVQEYVGTIDAEFTVGVLVDMDGELVDSIAMRRDITSGLSNRLKVRNRSGRPELGELLAISSGVSQGHIARYPEVSAECERLALELGARAAINIQCRWWNDRIYVFEINPRFSGTTSIRAMVGFNEPDWLVRHHVGGEPLPGRFEYESATVLRGLAEGAVVDRQS